MRPLDRLLGTGLLVAQAAAASGFVWLAVAPALAAGASAALLVATVTSGSARRSAAPTRR